MSNLNSTPLQRPTPVVRSIKSFVLKLPQTGSVTEFQLEGSATLAHLAEAAINAARRELGNVKIKLSGLPASDPQLSLDELKIKAPHTMLAIASSDSPGPMKSPRSIVASSGASALSLRELDEPAINWADTQEIERRICTRVEKYSGYVELSPPSLNKRVAVLDIDFTLLDTDIYNVAGGSVLLSPRKWCRPNLHDFLAAIAPYWNICCWSATGLGHILRKLRQAGVMDNPDQEYKLWCVVEAACVLPTADHEVLRAVS